MNTVIIINLNGNAFHLEESGYQSLRAYLERAQAQLKDNPDKAEIMADLEQAIADKCAHFLRPHKNVLSATEIDEVIKEMGPVQSDSGADAGAAGAGTSAGNGPNAQSNNSAASAQTTTAINRRPLFLIRSRLPTLASSALGNEPERAPAQIPPITSNARSKKLGVKQSIAPRTTYSAVVTGAPMLRSPRAANSCPSRIIRKNRRVSCLEYGLALAKR